MLSDKVSAGVCPESGILHVSLTLGSLPMILVPCLCSFGATVRNLEHGSEMEVTVPDLGPALIPSTDPTQTPTL